MKGKAMNVIFMIIGIIFVLALSLIIVILFSEHENFTFNFYVQETGELLEGELFINNISFGKTSDGKITIPVENLSITSFDFHTYYGEDSFNFPYDFSQDLLDWGEHDFIVYEEQLKPKKVGLIFYDNKTNCSLDGNIYVDDILLGETKKGIFILSENTYKEKFKQNSTLHIFGRTDFCFGKDANLPFAEYWEVYNLQYSFDNHQDVTFELSINPRWPRYYTEMQDFVRPEETREYLETELRGSFKNNTWEDLDKIASYMKISYITDRNRFQQLEYWQTPSEALKSRMGDCEDWAVTALSLMRAYNSSMKCYNILWQTHISILCYRGSSFVIYDQDKTKFSTALETEDIEDSGVLQENKIALRKMRNDYFSWYGISPSERRMYALFNDEELITFEKDEDFINWAIELIRE